jgi:hydrogenase maturation protease
MMKRILIIGYGNVLRADDGIGRIAAERLLEVLKEPNVTVLPCHQLMPELAEALSEADCALFIDAAAQGAPGVLSLTRVRPSFRSPDSFSHHVGPGELLAVTQSVYGRAPEAMVLTVSGEDFECGDDLSPTAAELLPEVVERVRQMVESECTNLDLESPMSGGEKAANPSSENGASNPSRPVSGSPLTRPRPANGRS